MARPRVPIPNCECMEKIRGGGEKDSAARMSRTDLLRNERYSVKKFVRGRGQSRQESRWAVLFTSRIVRGEGTTLKCLSGKEPGKLRERQKATHKKGNTSGSLERIKETSEMGPESQKY